MKRGKRPRFWITRDASMRLPNIGTSSEFAKALGVSRKTLSTWINKENLPCAHTAAFAGGGHTLYSYNCVIDRIEMLQWAQRTGRFDGTLYLNYEDQVLNGSIDEIPKARPSKQR